MERARNGVTPLAFPSRPGRVVPGAADALHRRSEARRGAGFGLRSYLVRNQLGASIESVGQTAAQEPHSMQVSGSIL